MIKISMVFILDPLHQFDRKTQFIENPIPYCRLPDICGRINRKIKNFLCTSFTTGSIYFQRYVTQDKRSSGKGSNNPCFLNRILDHPLGEFLLAIFLEMNSKITEKNGLFSTISNRPDKPFQCSNLVGMNPLLNHLI